MVGAEGINLIEVMKLQTVCGHAEFAFLCTPLSIPGANGAPVRPLALLDNTPEGGQ